MTWIRNQLAPDTQTALPAETVQRAKQYYLRFFSREYIIERIAAQKREIEHERACLAGMEAALAELQKR